jgi:hypothetical protein
MRNQNLLTLHDRVGQHQPGGIGGLPRVFRLCVYMGERPRSEFSSDTIHNQKIILNRVLQAPFMKPGFRSFPTAT